MVAEGVLHTSGDRLSVWTFTSATVEGIIGPRGTVVGPAVESELYVGQGGTACSAGGSEERRSE